MKNSNGFYRTLTYVFWAGVAATGLYAWHFLDCAIPDRISIIKDQAEELSFDLPFGTTLESESEEVVLGNASNIPADAITITKGETFSMYSQNQGSYHVGVKLFGLIELKEMQVNVVQARYAVPCGSPIGIYLKSDGVLVVGTGKITDTQGREKQPALGILKSGDYIESVNGQAVSTKEELMEAVNEAGESGARLALRRDGETIQVSVSPVQSADGGYKLGAWVRDDTQGIGTITYVDLDGNFGALGHGISDSDTGELLESAQGELYETQIMGIEKGASGTPGLLSGVIYYGPGTKMGEIKKNTQEGIFGTVGEKFVVPEGAMEIACRQEVVAGPAWIRSSVSGEVKDYAIEIQKVDYNAAKQNKSMVIKVTDPELIALTGGIVQGMSGSPIIQNNKLVGAVTHVFLQDPTRGYGILIENMLEAGESGS